MNSLVALDIETTGLDPERDAITEIGAVRFSGSRIDAEWSTLINPRRPIPPMISQLTGITNEMVQNAPLLPDVLPNLAEFIGDRSVIGHNVRFDLSFLQQSHILQSNDVIDTYELASVLLPTASRYNLSALGQILGVPVPTAHRALNDAHTTFAVFIRLVEKAKSLPIELLNEIVRLSQPFNWDANAVFQEIQKNHPNASGLQNFGLFPYENLFKIQGQEQIHKLTPLDPPIPLDIEEVAGFLEYGGTFSRIFSTYEYRPQQVEMTRAVANSINENLHLLVEAGTGIGKSYAYLIPAAIFATSNQRRVVISTNTINLQDQLINKDVPDLTKALGLDLRVAVLKGRINYLCPRKLDLMRQRMPENVDELRLLAKILVWLWSGGTGDRTEININGPAERDAWAMLSAEDEGCKNETCLGRMGGACPFFKVHRAAENAHLVIVNHALLLTDVATGNRIIPDYDHLIIDEAHHLETATTNALSFRVNLPDLHRLLNELGGTNSGVIGHILRLLHVVLTPADYANCFQAAQKITDHIFHLDQSNRQFFLRLGEFLEIERDGQPISLYGQQTRITSAIRTQPAWVDVEMAWDLVHESFIQLVGLLTNFYQSIGDIDPAHSEALSDLQTSLGTINRRISEADNYINGLVSNPSPDQIYWVEISPKNHSLSLQVAPLFIGPLVENHLWHQKSSVILTSATLTTDCRFDYLRERLNADEAEELSLGSPFDYESSALLYLVNDIPEPSDGANHQRSVEQILARLSKATGGRLLALFTSYAQLRRTSQAIAPILADAGILVYEQGEGASPNSLLETFRVSERAILLGTRAFWEGVDIPGDALSTLVIVKLPFDVPSDPIIAARSETYEDPFNEYHLQEAILRFRQGFGRLIRTQSDRGVVTILDRRVISKKYGKLFIQSLPKCTIQLGSMQDLPKAAARWLNV